MGVGVCVSRYIYINIYLFILSIATLSRNQKCVHRSKNVILCVAACTLNAAVDDTIHVAAAFLQQRQQIKHSLPTVPVTEIPQWRFSATVQERL